MLSLIEKWNRPAARCVGAIVGLLVSATALASDPPAGAHGDKAHGGGDPNILSGDLGNVFWTLTIFIVLLVVLRLVAWNPILQALRNRERFIEESLTKARHEREEAERLLKDYTQRIEKARGEATAIVEEGRRDAEVVRRGIQEDARKEASEMLARAKREIGAARDNAIKELYEHTLDIATDVAAKFVSRKLSAEDHRSLLDESLREMAETRRA